MSMQLPEESKSPSLPLHEIPPHVMIDHIKINIGHYEGRDIEKKQDLKDLEAIREKITEMLNQTKPEQQADLKQLKSRVEKVIQSVLILENLNYFYEKMTKSEAEKILGPDEFLLRLYSPEDKQLFGVEEHPVIVISYRRGKEEVAHEYHLRNFPNFLRGFEHFFQARTTPVPFRYRQESKSLHQIIHVHTAAGLKPHIKSKD